MKKLSILFVSLLICNSSYSQTDNLVVDDVYAKSIKKLTRNKKVKKAFNYIIDIEEKTNKSQNKSLLRCCSTAEEYSVGPTSLTCFCVAKHMS